MIMPQRPVHVPLQDWDAAEVSENAEGEVLAVQLGRRSMGQKEL